MTVERIYWDTDAFLGWLQEEPGKVASCKGTIERAENGEVLIVTSSLTLAEALWRKGGPRLPQEKLRVLRRFFRKSYIRVVNVTRSISETAQDVVYSNNIKPKDAVHVATALHLGIGILETFDKDLINESGKIGASPLLIRRPLPPVQRDFDFGKEKSG